MSDGPVQVALLLTTPGWRGSGTSFRKIAAGLVRHGHDVMMVAGDAAVAERLRQPGVAVHHVPTGDTGRREVAGARRLLRDHRSRVVLADAPRDVRIARYASLFTRRAIAWRYNLSRRDVPPDPLQRWLFGGLASIVQQSDFGTTRLREGMPWLTPRRVVTIANGFDGDTLRPHPEAGGRWRAAHRISPDELLVLTAGALVADKEPQRALEALAGSGATWVAAGNGPQQGDLSGRAAALGVTVRFVGQLEPGMLHDAMRAADLVLQPSPAELFPNVIAEAMTLGRPVAGAATGAAPEVIGDAGLLLPSDSSAAASRLVASLLADPIRREAFGAAARRRILEHFPLTKMESAFDRLVRSLA